MSAFKQVYMADKLYALGPVWIQNIFKVLNTTVLQNTLVFKSSSMSGCNKLCGFKNQSTIKIIVFLEF